MELDLHRGGSGEPLVLLHGIGHTWRGWKPMLPLLEERFDVLAPDLPGFGYSPPLPAEVPSTPEGPRRRGGGRDGRRRLRDGARVRQLARRLDRARARQVRGDLPGRAHTRARARPCPVDPARPALDNPQRAPAEPLLRNKVGRALFGGPTLGKPWRADPDDLIEQARLLAEAPGFDSTLGETTDRQVAGLPEIHCPVLVLWGTQDVILIPRQGRRF
jgi:pimeloyl-ACP methyl ester carboxylesterase